MKQIKFNRSLVSLITGGLLLATAITSRAEFIYNATVDTKTYTVQKDGTSWYYSMAVPVGASSMTINPGDTVSGRITFSDAVTLSGMGASWPYMGIDFSSVVKNLWPIATESTVITPIDVTMTSGDLAFSSYTYPEIQWTGSIGASGPVGIDPYGGAITFGGFDYSFTVNNLNAYADRSVVLGNISYTPNEITFSGKQGFFNGDNLGTSTYISGGGVSSVPEPSSLALLLIGLTGFGGYAARKHFKRS